MNYLLIDGENIDRTLGQILNKKPNPEQRPRWEKVREFVEKKFGDSCRALFFLNATNGLPAQFVQALKVAGFTPIALEGTQEQKVVDIAIIRTLEALKEQEQEESSEKHPAVILASHDVDFFPAFSNLESEDRELGIICFSEYISGNYNNLKKMQVFDLEEDVRAFEDKKGKRIILPRMRTIPIEQFDPLKFL